MDLFPVGEPQPVRVEFVGDMIWDDLSGVEEPATMSANSTRLFLKPVVFTFARLFAMTVIRVCCASRPVFATQSAASMF